MAFDLASITTGFGIRPPRIFLLGIEKIGKSSFAAGSNSPCFIPISGEEGLDDIRDERGAPITLPQFPPSKNLDDVRSALQAILNGGHNFSTVVIDSASTLEPLIWDQVCRDDGVSDIEKAGGSGGGYGKGYTASLKYWREITGFLDSIRSHQNMASILIGHVAVKTFNNPEGPDYDHYVPDINQKAAGLLCKWADAILFCNSETLVETKDAGFGKKAGKGIDITKGQRFIFTQKTPAHPGGGRGVYGKLPEKIPLYWSHYQAAVEAAVIPF